MLSVISYKELINMFYNLIINVVSSKLVFPTAMLLLQFNEERNLMQQKINDRQWTLFTRCCYNKRI